MRSEPSRLEALEHGTGRSRWSQRGGMECKERREYRDLEEAARRVLVRIEGLCEPPSEARVLRLAAQLVQEGRGPVRAQRSSTRRRQYRRKMGGTPTPPPPPHGG